jgi:hypothetical protein
MSLKIDRAKIDSSPESDLPNALATEIDLQKAELQRFQSKGIEKKMKNAIR